MITIKNVTLDLKTGKLIYKNATDEEIEERRKEALELAKAEKQAKDVADSEFELRLILKLAEWGIV